MHEKPITPAQLRAGRALLDLSQADVAGRACLSLHTIKLAEAEGRHMRPRLPWPPSGLLLRIRV